MADVNQLLTWFNKLVDSETPVSCSTVTELAVQCQFRMSIGRLATILRYSSRGKLDVKGKPAHVRWEQEELKVGTMTSRCYSTTDSVHTQTSVTPTEHSHRKMF